MINGDLLAIAPTTPQDPDRVGPFRLVGRLGASGMGVVYAGLDAGGRRAAVRPVRPELASDPDFRHRFSREVSLLHRVSGRCVARVVAADPSGSPPWFATEYVPGPTLGRRVERLGPLSGDELYGLAAGLAEALVSLHSRAVVHRDLRPANLILAPDGPKVVDLGIALDETSMTRTGVSRGSPGWISPERCRGEEVGPAADVYAWGLIVCYAATGRPPYGDGRPEVVAARVLNTSPDLAGVPDHHRETVERALSTDPDDRPTAPELLAVLTAPLGRGDPVRVATRFLDRTWVMPPVHDDPAWTVPVRRTPREKAYLAGGGTALAVATVLAAALLGYLPSHVFGAHAPAPSGAKPPTGDQAPPVSDSGPVTSGIGGKCLDVRGGGRTNGTAVRTHACDSTGAQVWTLPGDRTLRAFGKCLDVSNGGTADGTRIQLYGCNGSAAQQWIYGAPTGSLTNVRSGKCLDVTGSDPADDTRLQIYSCNGTAAQRWTLPN
ncbi:ricin-type beta-trefoil lectin domain protein [Actinomadura sp. DC4]|uniref:protein kinase domain-containing protein n=1 Tax=Actinomadura sp. DC4 TaxID=3055069 RepID=UPI0025B03974|nr:ricin-type beta-trefoil lectin domain protein [Actinomadura sp. DC4]MDN3359695.1 ricin-type beta-trefoil lectin domain protein [Actinomadura sp. DC4]